MKKWITSNYHYMVPEFDETSKINPDFSSFLEDCKRGIDILGADCATPVLLGPVSLVRLTNICDVITTKETLLSALLPVYKKLLEQVAALGATEIQIHEPVLVFDEFKTLGPLFETTYPAILPTDAPVAINMVSYMEDVGEDHYKWLISESNGLSIISLDFTRGNTPELVEQYGFPASKILGAGLIDSRNVWKVNPSTIKSHLGQLSNKKIKFRVQPSGSLQYTPWDIDCEKELASNKAGPVLSFAKQKLDEIVLVASAAGGNTKALYGHEQAWKFYRSTSSDAVQDRIQSLKASDFSRDADYHTRRQQQLQGVPLLPTTTIGSFPQTKAIRQCRANWKKGKLSDADYEAAMDQHIAYCIGLQEALGLDILVHGEPERTDMVEFFGQQLEGMLFTTNGWVQSFGSRCVRPPIIVQDIIRTTPMTTREFVVAQNLTTKPVKGMLTGPITILNWSFPRVDISRKEQAYQLALCLRDEILDLEGVGCQVIQVDEPALREGMPFRDADKDAYLQWAVDAFCLATAGAKTSTQIHTHMCYCEFQDCMPAIDRMDTDVNSIENARSGNATLQAFQEMGYTKGFGPGLYDIHSPVVPSTSSMVTKLSSFLQVLDLEKVVVNPDCGLKTRAWPETIAALRHMVEATKQVREQLGVKEETKE